MYDHILITTDGSDLAQKGVEAGLALAKSLGARATLLTVTERLGKLNEIPVWDPASGERPGYEDRVSQDHMAADILTRGEAMAREMGVQVETMHVADVVPADAIVATAQAQDCQLIAMASHGRSGLGRIMLGSQTSDVLARSSVPVLVVR